MTHAQIGGPGPVITDFNPKRGAPGTRIVIGGQNLPDDPNAICLVIQAPRTFVPIPLEVVDSSTTQITAVLGSWAATDCPPGPIVLSVGEGAVAAVDQLEFANVTVKAPIRAWARDLRHTERAESAEDFAPLAGELPEIFRVSRPPENGVLTVGPALQKPPIWGFTCEVTICEIIRRSLTELLGVVVQCDASVDGTIQFGLPNGAITNGVLTLAGTRSPDGTGWDVEIRLAAFDETQGLGVCLHAPSVILPEGDPDGPIITGFIPSQGGPGTEVTVTGENFDPDPKNGCLTLAMGAESFPVRLTEASETRLVGVVGPIGPLPLKPHPAWILHPFYTRGRGAVGTFTPGFADVELGLTGL